MFWRRRLGWLLAASLTVIGIITVWLLVQARGVLAPFLLALLLAYVLEPLVVSLVRVGLARRWAILLLYAIGGTFVFLFFWFVVPSLADEVTRFSEQAPDVIGRWQAGAEALLSRYRQSASLLGLGEALDRAVARFEAGVLRQADGLLATLLSVPRGLVAAVLAPLLAYYVLRDLDVIRRRVLGAVPLRLRPEVIVLGERLDRVVGGFIRGQLTVAAIVGVLVALACALLGLRYPVLIGVIAGVADIVPYFGPVIGAIPAIAAGLAISPMRALQVAVALLLIQQLENSVIAPVLLGGRVGLHPLFVVLAVLAGGHFGGIVGMLVAVPLLGVLRVLVNFGWEKILQWREANPL
jgi:predicted PurR-regulated permease PerM